ncbi:MAG: hypothetical protein KUG56_02035 [Kordiimonadaceae bacterium]|nr:hypothetical protein [Kordiimonadaceae bacterium]
MTVTHILITIAFICMGGAGLAAMQEGFGLMWQQYKKASKAHRAATHTHRAAKVPASTNGMKISYR